MREIKFRAWDKEAKNMKPVPGLILHWALEHPEDFELMQFTGLLDKAGRDIYEGDIVKHRLPGQINCIQGPVTIEASRGVCVGSWPISFDIEVIGNVWETGGA